jgi:hypothetical protein
MGQKQDRLAYGSTAVVNNTNNPSKLLTANGLSTAAAQTSISLNPSSSLTTSNANNNGISSVGSNGSSNSSTNCGGGANNQNSTNNSNDNANASEPANSGHRHHRHHHRHHHHHHHQNQRNNTAQRASRSNNYRHQGSIPSDTNANILNATTTQSTSSYDLSSARAETAASRSTAEENMSPRTRMRVEMAKRGYSTSANDFLYRIFQLNQMNNLAASASSTNAAATSATTTSASTQPANNSHGFGSLSGFRLFNLGRSNSKSRNARSNPKSSSGILTNSSNSNRNNGRNFFILNTSNISSNNNNNSNDIADLDSDISSDEDEPHWSRNLNSLTHSLPFFFGMKGIMIFFFFIFV